ncbi:RxLR effector candidate protein [Elysia marginata]|uniref:RxLR effector candidate protein n=1 Tax=Elysia marginata TaxID=1093978 RepID=A0AAV4EJN4_9GAST|nr:RxLR effector candidate protein [Elysia marginata]
MTYKSRAALPASNGWLIFVGWLVCVFQHGGLRVWRKALCRPKGQEPKVNIANLINTEECRTNANPAQSVSERLSDIQAATKQSSKESLGIVTTTKQRKHTDPEISVLSKEQKEIRIKIQNTKDDNETRARLNIERNKILHTTRRRQIKLHNQEIERKLEDINQAQCDHAMFKATNLLNQKHFENPKVEDREGKLATRPNDILDIILKTNSKMKRQG